MNLNEWHFVQEQGHVGRGGWWVYPQPLMRDKGPLVKSETEG